MQLLAQSGDSLLTLTKKHNVRAATLPVLAHRSPWILTLSLPADGLDDNCSDRIRQRVALRVFT